MGSKVQSEGLVGMKQATFPTTGPLTGIIDLEGAKFIALSMPTAWTAAVITIQSAITAGGTYQDVYDDDGNEISLAVAASQIILVDEAKLAALRHIKLRSGIAASIVTQEAIRIVDIITKG